MNIYEKYLLVKSEIEEKKKELTTIEDELYTKHQEELKNVIGSSKTIKNDGYKFTFSYLERISVKDQKKAEALYHNGNGSFKIKFEFDKSKYKELNEEQKKLVDSCLESKLGKPSFKVSKEEE